MKALLFIFLVLSGFSTLAEEMSLKQIDCFRRVNPYTELTDTEKREILKKAHRFHHGFTGKWGHFLEFSQAVVVGNTIQVVVRFSAEPRNLEIVAIYDYETKKISGFLAPDSKNRGLQAFELK